MKIRLYNARVLPLSGGAPEPLFGEIHVDGDAIAYVGPAPGPDGDFDRAIDCRGGVLLPGFKNAHTHSAMTFLRSYADDLPLKTWLFDKVFPLERKLTPDDVYWLTKLAILEYVSGGTTLAFDMYFFRDAIAAAAVETGFRMTLMSAANDFGGTAEECEDEYRKFSGFHPLIRYRVGGHAEYTTSLPLLRDLATLVKKLNEPFFSHMNETESEVTDCVARHGLRPFELYDSLGLFDCGGGGFHCVHLSESEMEILARRKLFAVTCPASNLKLSSGIAPIYELTQRGVPVCVATDGPASNNCLDMFREMFLTSALQKYRCGADKLDGADVLAMACVNGAHACGFPDCDCLAPGKQADLVLLDLDRPNMRPVSGVAKNIVYAGNKGDVRLTMIAGRIVYENGEYCVGCDPRQVYEKAQAVIDRMRMEA